MLNTCIYETESDTLWRKTRDKNSQSENLTFSKFEKHFI